MKMKRQCIICSAVFALCVNCIGWRGNNIKTSDTVPQIQAKIQQPVSIYAKAGVAGSFQEKALKESAEKHFKAANLTVNISGTDSPGNGYLITYNWEQVSKDTFLNGFMNGLGIVTVGIIPSWNNKDIVTKVKVYKGNQVLKEYVYTESMTQLNQILLIFGMPFAFPGSVEEKIADTIVMKSVADIEKDIQFK